MVLGHVLDVGRVLPLAAVKPRVHGDHRPAVHHRDRRRGQLHVDLLADERVVDGVVHVVDGDVVVRGHLGAAPLAHLVALGGKGHQVHALLLEHRVARAVLGGERPGVEPCHLLRAELVELVDGIECHLAGRPDDPALNQVDARFGHALVARPTDPGGQDGRPVVLGEALVLPVHERDPRGCGPIGRRGGVVGHPHARNAAELLERVDLALLPGFLPHVAEALRPELVREGQRDDQDVDLGPGSQQLVGEVGDVAGPIDEALGPRLVGEVPGRAHLACGVGEHLAERLVGVGELPLRRGALAVLEPEELHRQLPTHFLALDQRRHVGSQVGVVRTALLLGEEHVIDRVGVHRAHGVERQAAFAHHLGAGGDVALADVKRGRDVRLGGPSLGQHQEDFLVLGHRHRAPFHESEPRIGLATWNSRLDGRRYQFILPRVPSPLTGGTRFC